MPSGIFPTRLFLPTNEEIHHLRTDGQYWDTYVSATQLRRLALLQASNPPPLNAPRPAPAACPVSRAPYIFVSLHIPFLFRTSRLASRTALKTHRPSGGGLARQPARRSAFSSTGHIYNATPLWGTRCRAAPAFWGKRSLPFVPAAPSSFRSFRAFFFFLLPRRGQDGVRGSATGISIYESRLGSRSQRKGARRARRITATRCEKHTTCRGIVARGNREAYGRKKEKKKRLGVLHCAQVNE